MDHLFDEFSKSLTESVPRRESLRRLGAVFAGALLSPLGLEAAPFRAPVDPCKAFCKCANKSQQNACLAACQACNGDTKRLCGKCGTYTCCSKACCNGACSDLSRDPNCGACGNNCRAFGKICCGSYCADLANDVHNCGTCGHVCPPPDPYEVGGCFGGTCIYACAPGAVECNGVCTDLGFDPDNCGACGNVCGGPNPSCYQGTCSHCTPSCPEGWCGGNGCGGVCGCPSGMYCEGNWCYSDCVFPFILCGGVCVDPTSNRNNCGGCGVQCASDEACISGFCVSG